MSKTTNLTPAEALGLALAEAEAAYAQANHAYRVACADAAEAYIVAIQEADAARVRRSARKNRNDDFV